MLSFKWKQHKRMTKSYLAACLWLVALAGIAFAFNLGCQPPAQNDTTPPGSVTNLTATRGDTKIDLAWQNPGDFDFDGVLIRRKAGSVPTSVTDGDQAYNGGGTSFTDTGLVNGTTYHYAAYAYDTSDNYAAAATASATPAVALAIPGIIERYVELIEKFPPPGPDPEAQLGAKLGESLLEYAGGNPCEAAALLVEYQMLAQGFRQAVMKAADKGAFEEFYNLGRRLRYDMIADTSLKAECLGQERVGDPAAGIAPEATSDNLGLLPEISFGEPKVWTVRAGEEGQPEEVFTQLDIPGADGILNQPGMPAIPVFRTLVAVPRGATTEQDPGRPRVVVTFDAPSVAEEVFLNLVPVAEQPVDQDGLPPLNPDDFLDRPFQKNDDLYAGTQPFPADGDLVRISDVHRMRDLDVVILEVAAGQFRPDPQQNKLGKLALFDKVNVHFTFERPVTGGDMNFLPGAATSPFESNPTKYNGPVLNASAVAEYLGPVVVTPVLLGEELMILTPTSFRSAADTLATWKNTKGIVTKVFEVGVGTAYTTNTLIQELIEHEFDTRPIRPSYVLLLGDSQHIPTFYEDPNGNVGSAFIGSDYPYASFDGLIPIFPDVALGRIPVSDLTGANTVVGKIIGYEQSPPTDSAFYNKAAIAAQFQCCRDDVADPGTDQRTFIEVSEFARNVLVAAGKSVDRIYTETGTATPRRYFDGTLLPAALGPGYAWGGTNADIINAFNDGRFLFIHRDHGWPGGWSHPDFDMFDASALTNVTGSGNTNQYSIVFSVNCASGLFDGESGDLGTTGAGQYFAERMLTNTNGGAVGILGDSRNSPSWANSALLRGFMDAIWPTALSFGTAVPHHRLGDVLDHGKIYLFTQGGMEGSGVSWDNVGDELRLWHCLGDPTLEIWTSRPSIATLPGSITISVGAAFLIANYADAPDGVTLTAFQQNEKLEWMPISRGVVADKVANLPLLPGVGLNRQMPVRLIATLNSASTKTLEASLL